MKKGFTLSEVLITLGIIGVVAAMTMPVLIQQQQKLHYVIALKKAYSVWEQAFQRMQTEDEYYIDNLYHTNFFSKIPTTNITDKNEYWKNNLSKYIQMVDFIPSNSSGTGITYKRLSGGVNVPSLTNFASIYTPDGMIYYIALYSNSTSHVWIDVNADKAPNQWGRDMFRFSINNDGRLIPYDSEMAEGDDCSNEKIAAKESLGYECAQRIMKDGWKMNY